jgi:hypothetical protein
MEPWDQSSERQGEGNLSGASRNQNVAGGPGGHDLAATLASASPGAPLRPGGHCRERWRRARRSQTTTPRAREATIAQATAPMTAPVGEPG